MQALILLMRLHHATHAPVGPMIMKCICREDTMDSIVSEATAAEQCSSGSGGKACDPPPALSI